MRRISLVLVVALALAVAVTVQSATRSASTAAATGAIKVANPGVVVELKLEKPTPLPNGREVPMPAGTYTIATITAYAPEKADAKAPPTMWSIKSLPPYPTALAKLPVQEGATTTIDCGPPFKVVANVGKPTIDKTGQKLVSVGLAITGKAGESYSAATIMKGLQRVPAPLLQIVDEKNNVLAQGTFAYG
jgi:hypothetical protein